MPTNTVVRAAYAQVERYVERKYADVLSLQTDEIAKVPRKIERILFWLEEEAVDIARIEDRAKRLRPSERVVLARELKLFVADCVGDLVETFRYESIAEGEAYESFLDELLTIAERLSCVVAVQKTKRAA